MTFLNKQKEMARKKMWGAMYLAECEDLQYETVATDLDTLVEQIVTNTVNEILNGVPEKILEVDVNKTPRTHALNNGYNLALMDVKKYSEGIISELNNHD